jgi:hypothetical protein
LSSYFDIDTNPAKWGFMRAGAAIFREVGVAPLGGFITCPLLDSKDVLLSLAKLHIKYDRDILSALNEQPDASRRNMLGGQFVPSIASKPPLHRDVIGPHAKLEWSVEKGKGFYCARGRCAMVYTGHAERFEKATEGQISVVKPDFAALTVTALDGEPSVSLEKSKKILVTACGRCENVGMKFSEDRRTVGRNWGEPPVQIETVEGSLLLPKGRWVCRTLGPDGLPTAEVPVSYRDGQGVLRLSPQYKTIWYLLTRAGGQD